MNAVQHLLQIFTDPLAYRYDDELNYNDPMLAPAYRTPADSEEWPSRRLSTYHRNLSIVTLNSDRSVLRPPLYPPASSIGSSVTQHSPTVSFRRPLPPPLWYQAAGHSIGEADPAFCFEVRSKVAQTLQANGQVGPISAGVHSATATSAGQLRDVSLSARELAYLSDVRLAGKGGTFWRLERLGREVIAEAIGQTFSQAAATLPGSQATWGDYAIWLDERSLIDKNFFVYKSTFGTQEFLTQDTLSNLIYGAGLNKSRRVPLDTKLYDTLDKLALGQDEFIRNCNHLNASDALKRLPWQVSHFFDPAETAKFNELFACSSQRRFQGMPYHFCHLGVAYLRLRLLAKRIASQHCFESCQRICSAVGLDLDVGKGGQEATVPTQLASAFIAQHRQHNTFEPNDPAVQPDKELRIKTSDRLQQAEKDCIDSLTKTWQRYRTLAWVMSLWLKVEPRGYSRAKEAIFEYSCYLVATKGRQIDYVKSLPTPRG